ncbi:hypothetical protein PHYSODRAFT_315602 [Phytophthora sojae]|uniref:PDZ domain-containing protein n=1 Tax=Phytophthora sojae (strain P6497) TaxID=1094619 RepID=G4ZN07_PHYSP|nr:hypothetical protein PHYSODRAFT_315602 [Phytophthora sojae]EGZ15036.1 hypothetical protein PHYSODRAFT_315602 [Phytophthora sojae]|eukprot:XP_009528785.1 hypothetical protein PHYSODRAFT_315602 [Phytophthora sojae]
MAKAIISSVLEAQLGKYVAGLRSDSLVVGLWSGELELRDLALKPHALAELQLPVAVASGSVGRVLVRVPWNQLGSASVTITLEGVSALVVPNTERPSAAELLQAKKNQLERRELLRQHRRFAARVGPGQELHEQQKPEEDEGTFVSRLTARIVANLQVTLRDVHLRYEDAVANPEAPFACGLMLERFRYVTTDEEGREAFVDQATVHSAFTYKKIELSQFGMYWDRLDVNDKAARLETREDVPQAMRAMVQELSGQQEDTRVDSSRRWLLRPCSLGVQLTKNESTDYSAVAKYTVEAEMGALQASLTREQYEDVLFLQRAFLGRRAVEAHFALARGRPLHAPGARPREWWDYATRLVLEQRRAKLRRQAANDKNKEASAHHPHRRRPHHRKMRWSSVHKALLEQQLYVEAFRTELRNGAPLDPSTRQGKFKQRYEEIYPLDVVLLLRDVAEDAEERANEEAKASAKEHAKTQAAQGGGGSWYSYFFGGETESASASSEAAEEHVLSAEGRENLREAYNDAVEKASNAHEVPMGCNMASVQLQLTNGSIGLYQSNAHESPFVTGMLSGSLAVNIQPENEWDASFQVQHFDIFNGLARDSRFHSFCSPSSSLSPSEDPSRPCVSIDVSRRAVLQTQLQGDDDVEATLKVRVRSEPVRMMVDPSFVMFLHAFFVSLLPEKQLERVWQFATSSVADWMFTDDSADERKLIESSNTSAEKEAEEAELMRSLERAEGRVAYDVLLDMEAPVLILPENVGEPTGAVLVVDLGRLSFRNDEQVTAIDTPLEVGLEPAGEDPRRLHWRLDVTQIHVLLGRQEQLVDWTDEELRGFTKIVKELSVEFSLHTQAATSRLKLPSRTGRKNVEAKPLPQVGVYAAIPNISVCLVEEQLVALGQIHSSIVAQAAIIARDNDQESGDEESATESESTNDEGTSNATVVPIHNVEEKFLLEMELSLGCVELNLRESVAKDAFILRASQTSFSMEAYSTHQDFHARLKALVMEDKLYSAESRYYKLISTGEDDAGDTPHLIAIDITAYSQDNGASRIQESGQASQLEADVQFNVLHLQWNPSSVALFYRIISAYASAIQSHDDDLPSEDATLPRRLAAEKETTQEPRPVGGHKKEAAALTSLRSRGKPLVVVRASLVQFSLTFNKDQLDRQLARLDISNAAVNYTSYDIEGQSSADEDTFEVTGHVGNFVGTDLSTSKHPLYSPLLGLDEEEARRRVASGMDSEALLTFAFVRDPKTSDKSSLRLAFKPIRGVYYHQQVLELVDFVLEGVLGAMLLLRKDEASVVLDLTVEKPTLILPLSLEDSPHAKVTADMLRLVHFPSSAVHYEGPPGARTKRVVHDEPLPRAMVRRSDAEGGGVSLRVDCKDLFLEQVRIFCTTTSAGRRAKSAGEGPMYEDLLPKPADLKISIEDLVSSSISLGDEETVGDSGETRTAFLPRITVDSVLPPLEAHISRTSYLGIVALILENFGADALQNAPTAAAPLGKASSASRLLSRRRSSADIGELPSLRPTVTYTYLQPDADEATLQPVHLGAFSARDLVGNYKTSSGGAEGGTMLISPRPLEIHYTWDDAALTGELDLAFSEVTGTVIPEALLALTGFFALPSRPSQPEKPPSSGSVKDLVRSQTPVPPPSPSLLTRRESISDILRDGKEPELTITVRATAKQVGVAVPRDCYDPESPRVAFAGDFALEFKWKPHPDDKKGKADDDLDIQSSILADARNMEIVLENARRPGCCVASPSSSTRWDAIDVAPLIQLLEPCDLHVEVSDLFPHAGQRQQIVALSFTPIEVFVSYDDACMAMDTMEAFNEAIVLHEARHSTADLRRPSRIDSPTSHALTRSRTSSKSIVVETATEEEIHRYFTCELPSVSLTLINDCDGCDMGLAQLQVERCHLFLNVTYTAQLEESDDAPVSFVELDVSVTPLTTSISGGGNLVVLMSYYNPDTRDWHPMCTEWALDASVQGSISGASELHVILTASQALDLTVTHGLLEVVASVGGAWKRRAAMGTAKVQSDEREDEDVERRKMAPCVIRNETGLPLSFWLTNGSFTTEPQVVSTGSLADVRYLHAPGRGRGVVRRYASGDRDAANLRLCLQLMDAKSSEDSAARFQAVQGLIFEQLGARTFPLVDTHGQRTNFTLSLSAQLVEGRILLVVSSPIKLVNRLTSGRPVALLVNDPTWHTPVEIGVLRANQESAVPVLLSLASELRVRPVGNGATYSWSAPIPVQTRSAVELKVEAAVSSTSASRESSSHAGDGRSAVYCVSMSSDKELRAVSFAEPLVLVNKLPVPLTFRLRSAYSSAYGSGSSDSPSKPETIAVGAKTSIWWTDIAQRPLFQLLVEGCTSPSKWLELVPRGTASGAVLSVQLTRVDDGRPFRLLLRVVGGDHAARPVRVEILAEVWVINRSGLELVYGTAADSEAYIPPRAARAQVGNAQISAYSSDNSGKVPVVRIGLRGCNWSARFEADPRRLSWQDECITLRSAGSSASSGGVLYELGVSADYATRHFGSVTTLVSVIPRYLILNRSSHTLLLLEAPNRQHQRLEDSSNDNVAHHVLGAGDMYALYWVGGTRAPLRASVLPDDDAPGTFCCDGYDWSAAFAVDRVAKSDLLVPPRSSGRGVHLEVVVKRGSFSQATFVVVVTDGGAGSPTSTSSRLSNAGSTVSSSARDAVTGAGTAGWQTFSLHAQVAGVIVTVTDKKHGGALEDSKSLFAGGPEGESEPVARATFTRIGVEASWSPQATAAKLNLMGLKVEDLLPQTRNRVVLRPLLHGDSASAKATMDKYFLELTYLERPHAKYTWVERVHLELQNIKVSTSMSFVDRLIQLQKETIAHFQHKSLVSAFPSEDDINDEDDEDGDLLAYFVPQTEDGDEGVSAADMAAMTGRKLYIASGEISPVRVVVSFTRDKSDSSQRNNEGFWLSNLKLKIDNACVTLEGYRLSHALATQESLTAAIVRFYEQSVKSQALGLIESIEVTSLVTSMVAGGVTSLVSTLRGKADPAAAAGAMAPGMLTSSSSSSDGDSSQGVPFRYEHMSNGEILRKHSKALGECRSSAEFLRQVRHLVYDWDANHTGLEARGCVALALINNSRHSLVVNTQLNDGASLRVLPLGRRHLASVLDAPTDSGTASAGGGSATAWRADRAVVVFAYGYTPTLLTSGDVYFTVQSNACSVYATRKTARLRANRGYTATFTLQETQSWWSANVVIIGDDLQAGDNSTTASDSDSLFGETPALMDQDTEAADDEDDEFEVEFSGAALGLVAKQSGRLVIVRECVPSSAAQASGRIAPGDCILAVNGDGSITRLPARFKRPWQSNKKEEAKHAASAPAAAVQNKLAELRSKRVMEFFQAKARQRAGARSLASVVGSSGDAVMALLRSLRHLAAGFFKRKTQNLTALIGREAEGAALLSRELVGRIMDEQPPILALKFVAMRERERRAKNARVIQRLWRRVKRNEQASADAKVRILNMLTSMPSRLRQQQETQQQTIKIVHDVSSSATRLFIHRAAQRLAARLIQRVWRGHCARKRARRLREWRLRKFLRRRQRDRLRDARTALLMPSEVEQRYRKELETRTLARQQETPLLPCVPFSRFEKIIAQDARVNLRNVWVAIPVGHHEQQEETSSRHGGLSPLLVGKGRKKRSKGGLRTTYDWVPADLLQSQEEREVARVRRRQRATSPSVAKNILEF